MIFCFLEKAMHAGTEHLAIRREFCYNLIRYGRVAQLVRAHGSHP